MSDKIINLTQSAQSASLAEIGDNFDKAYDHASMFYKLMWNIGDDDLPADDARTIGRRGYEAAERMRLAFNELLESVRGDESEVRS